MPNLNCLECDMSDSTRYLIPRQLFDSAIIEEGERVIYDECQIKSILINDYYQAMRQDPRCASAPDGYIYEQCKKHAEQWLIFWQHGLFAFRGPLIINKDLFHVKHNS